MGSASPDPRCRCSHQNWYFLPWHRAYLLAFEDICRHLSGDSAFALPYWDWVKHPNLPPAVTDPASPLFDITRELKPGDVRPAPTLLKTTSPSC